MSVETLRKLLTLREAIREARAAASMSFGQNAELDAKFAAMAKIEAEITKQANEWDTENRSMCYNPAREF